jgi:hypothetical protein
MSGILPNALRLGALWTLAGAAIYLIARRWPRR